MDETPIQPEKIEWTDTGLILTTERYTVDFVLRDDDEMDEWLPAYKHYTVHDKNGNLVYASDFSHAPIETRTEDDLSFDGEIQIESMISSMVFSLVKQRQRIRKWASQ